MTLQESARTNWEGINPTLFPSLPLRWQKMTILASEYLGCVSDWQNWHADKLQVGAAQTRWFRKVYYNWKENLNGLTQHDQMWRNKKLLWWKSSEPKKGHKLNAKLKTIRTQFRYNIVLVTPLHHRLHSYRSTFHSAQFLRGSVQLTRVLGDYNQLTVTQRCWVAQRIQHKDKGWMMFPVA